MIGGLASIIADGGGGVATVRERERDRLPLRGMRLQGEEWHSQFTHDDVTISLSMYRYLGGHPALTQQEYHIILDYCLLIPAHTSTAVQESMDSTNKERRAITTYPLQHHGESDSKKSFQQLIKMSN
eukprot:scaffold15992_cov63-Attheya_sp.AAC.2